MVGTWVKVKQRGARMYRNGPAARYLHHTNSTAHDHLHPALVLTVFRSAVRLHRQQTSAPELPKAFRDKFATVPAGALKTEADEVQVTGFMISATEVSNGDYMAFVDALRATRDEAALKVAMPDPKQWAQIGAGVEPYETHYHTHPAYTNYPVVNVSREGALAYCQWLQNALNKEAGAAKYEVRLPSRTEWWYAANGGHHKATYAWGGPALRNVKGCTLANYRQVGDENVRRDPVSGNVLVVVEHPVNLMGVAGSYSDNAAITAPVHAYSPNDFGLYNVNGNVAGCSPSQLTKPQEATGAVRVRRAQQKPDGLHRPVAR
ncbi:MAG: SUMF1/EgtB/PvdO family nonheme iron enzyme, partial [Flavobacteriales bacterium]|nr:SUMF1/EgtB/PvdO family nonheme iron enzyme [Flavobacteriales bacterium]